MIPSAARRYWRLNDPFCSERGCSDGYSEDCQCFEWPGQPIKIAHSPWDFVTLSEYNRAMAIGNTRGKIGKDRARSSGDIPADRQTDRQTHRRVRHNTSPPLQRGSNYNSLYNPQ